MKTANRMKLSRLLLSLFLCVTVYLLLASALFDLNLQPLAS
jgi:hypothetical protein